MLAGLTADQVRALAPDDGVARSGEGLASPRHWTALGRSDRAAWGLCQGSGASPYQVVADLTGPATSCTCPSRKFPCKHGLGLLLLLAREPGLMPPADAPPYAATWLAGRDARAQAAETRAPRGDGPVDEAARAKRIAAREQKVAAGVAELDRWLRDVIRRGLATAKAEGYGFWDAAGARLVDAQAGGLARSVRALGEIVNSGDGWPDRTLERLGRIHLLASAYGRQDALPEALRSDVRTLVGWTTKEDDLPVEGEVEDRWLAVGRTVEGGDERLTTARTWFVGEASGRVALHLAFGVAGATPELLATTGSAIRATFAFFPGATPLRAAARGPLLHAGSVDKLPAGASISASASAFTALLERNPFVESWPVLLAEVTPVLEGASLLLVDAAGDSIPAGGGEAGLRLLAASGGRPVTVVGEWLGDRVTPLSAFLEDRLVDLTLEQPPARGNAGTSPTRDRWRDLVTTALLGTGRGQEPEAGVVLSLMAGGDAAVGVLATAGARAVERRAGWAPSPGPAMPDAADADPRPVAGPAARAILRRILRARHEALTVEWLELAEHGSVRLPDEEWPQVLAMAATSAVVRGAIGTTSSRVSWLHELVPELHAGTPGVAGVTRAGWGDARDAAERAQALTAIRRRDPEEGRAILEGDWSSLPPDTRPRVVEALAEGLGAADEPFLERALGERRAETRAAAAELLARLPDSAFAARMADRARPLITLGGRLRPSLEIRLPTWDDGFERDGIVRRAPAGTGERAWWRDQLLARVAPSRWESWLGVDPGELIQRASRSDDGPGVVVAWGQAALTTRDTRWARALVERAATTAAPLGPTLVELVALLPRDEAEALVTRHLLTPIGIATVPGPWSPGFGRRVLEVIARDREASPSSETRALARIAAQRLPAAAAADLETAVRADRPPHLVSAVFGDAIDHIRVREQLVRAFEPSR